MEIRLHRIGAVGGIVDSDPTIIIDSYESLIWTERFNGYGDFELCLPSDFKNMDYIFDVFRNKFDILLELRGSKTSMLLENIEFVNDFENGNKYILSGRSLECLLERRIIWEQTLLTGNVQNGIKKLLNENAISPSNHYRSIGGLEFEDSTDEYITGLSATVQFTGDSLYDAIFYICDEFDMGFEIKRKYLITKNEADKSTYVFKLIRGKDRSYSQTTAPYDFAHIQKLRKMHRQYRSDQINDYVIFSDKFDNVLSSDYLYSLKNIKNIALIAGEGEGASRKMIELDPTYGASTEGAYWSRRELYVDARDISSDTEEGQMSDQEYNNMLIERGYEKIIEYLDIDSISGQFDFDGQFKIDEDFYLGDVVSVIFPIYRIKKKAKITEIIISEDQNGIRKYPTLELF